MKPWTFQLRTLGVLVLYLSVNLSAAVYVHAYRLWVLPVTTFGVTLFYLTRHRRLEPADAVGKCIIVALLVTSAVWGLAPIVIDGLELPNPGGVMPVKYTGWMLVESAAAGAVLALTVSLALGPLCLFGLGIVAFSRSK